MSNPKSIKKITVRLANGDRQDIKKAAAKIEESVNTFCKKALRVRVAEVLASK